MRYTAPYPPKPEPDMITEIVTFRIPAGMSPDEVLALYEKSVPVWQANPHLLRKNYLYDPQANTGGGVYTWKTKEAALEGHGEAFKARIRETFGCEPEFAYFETPIVVDNEHSE